MHERETGEPEADNNKKRHNPEVETRQRKDIHNKGHEITKIKYI